MKIYPVFHVALLKPYIEDKIEGRKQPIPDPIVTPEGEEEWEVENILNAKTKGKGRNKSILYLIKWKGFGPENNTWEPLENLENSQKLLKKFHNENPEFGPYRHP